MLASMMAVDSGVVGRIINIQEKFFKANKIVNPNSTGIKSNS